jgi:tRNA threonylcarbamoyladenosine biosynthesis protein TsaB
VLVLALDTATAAAACCLWRDGSALAESSDHGDGRSAQRVLGLVDAALAESGTSLTDVGAIAVGTGPGSFTGLRVGLATARGLGLALDVPVGGAGTLDALRAGAAAEAVAVIDARRGEVFAAGPGLEPAAVDPAVLAAGLGPGAVCIGDGALRYRSLLEAAGAEVPPDGDPRHTVSAAAVAALAARDGFATPAEPRYLRRPDAVEAA